MIDEKKIEQATNKYAQNELYYHDFQSSIAGFKAGISWFKDSLWHDVSEEPEPDSIILGEVEDGNYTYYVSCRFFKNEDWKFVYKRQGYKRWLYIEDLMKGDKK